MIQYKIFKGKELETDGVYPYVIMLREEAEAVERRVRNGLFIKEGDEFERANLDFDSEQDEIFDFLL